MPESSYVKIGTITGILALVIAYLTLAYSAHWAPFSTHDGPRHPAMELSSSPSAPSSPSASASSTRTVKKHHASARQGTGQIPVPLSTLPGGTAPIPSATPTYQPPVAPAANASGQIVGYGGMCLDVRGPSTADGTAVQIWTCNGVAEEQWRLVSGQIVGYGGMCLDVRGPSTADGTAVQIWTCNGVAEEQWRLVSGQIVGYGGMCLDVRGPSTADGTAIQIWTCNGVTEEQWITQ